MLVRNEVRNVFLGCCSWNQLRYAVDAVVNDRYNFVEAMNVLVGVILMMKLGDNGFHDSDVSRGGR